MTEKVGLREKVVPVRVKSLNDLARMAASIATLGQSTYLIRFRVGGKVVYGLVALLRDYYDLYGLPILYYYAREPREEDEKAHFLLVKFDEHGEHVEFSASSALRPGWVSIPVIDLAEKPRFFPDELSL